MATVASLLKSRLDAYDSSPPRISFDDLCFSISSVANHLWPSIVPDSLLVKLWMAVKDETLKHLTEFSRRNERGVQNSFVSMQRLIETISLFLSQCPDLPFELYWEECAQSVVQMANDESIGTAVHNLCCVGPLFEGLLHLMSLQCANNSPFQISKFEEASLARFYFLMRLLLHEADASALLFPNLETYTNLRFGFQITLDLLQTDTLTLHASKFSQPAWRLLEDLRRLNEDEWTACLASLLHQILKVYLEKGPTSLERMPIKTFLKLFSKGSFAKAFLDCITICPESHGSSSYSVLATAFQIFELAYRNQASAVISSCLTKLVDGQSDTVFLRSQCLNLVGRVQNANANIPEGATRCIWTEEMIIILFKSIIYDSSVRVRRLAMQILLQLSSSILDEKELIRVCLMKIRDQDEKVRLLAFQRLAEFPMKVLAETLTNSNWRALFERGFSENKQEFNDLAEGFLLQYVTTDVLAEAPSARLQALSILSEGDGFQKYFNFIYKHVEAIFEREKTFIDSSEDMEE